jgi:hypothetical protein
MDITTMTIEQLEITSNNTLKERSRIVYALNILNERNHDRMSDDYTDFINSLNVLNERYHRILAILKKRVNPQ